MSESLRRRVRNLESSHADAVPAEIRAVVARSLSGREQPTGVRPASLRMGRRLAAFVAAARDAVTGDPLAVVAAPRFEDEDEGDS